MSRYSSRKVVAVGIVILSSLGWVGGGAAHAGMNAASGILTKTMIRGPYKLTLDIGPLEHMYTMAQMKKTHPKTGEVMVSGTMTMSGMGMNGMKPNHHLELHVYNGTTGKTITKAMVMITVRDAMGKLLERVPIATMYGIKNGMADFHFGNNVALKAGNYQVVTQVNKVTATFKVTVGKGSSGGMSM
ncbi:MAG TPA: hypothetical protein VNL35_01910 [Chloroflexota bacterium]|nr:hypothetical protein [Chloroflexota bacterium]